MFLDFENAFDFQGVFNFKLNNYDFSFFENYDFQKNYDFQNKNNYFYFSDLFFFNSLQSNDFSFLHRDFYSFYPIFKYMTMCAILLGKMSIDDINYMRNCIVFADFKNLSNNEEFLNFSDTDPEFSARYQNFILNRNSLEIFDDFISNINSSFFSKAIVKKFFNNFVNNEIFFQQVDESSLNNIAFNFKHLPVLTQEQRVLFFYSFNKGFNGILEMLHFFNKVKFPKRGILLQDFVVDDFTAADTVFWKFWFFPKFFLNSSFFFFRNNYKFFFFFKKFFLRKNFFWFYNLSLFETFFSINKSFSSNFFWNIFFDLDDFFFKFFFFLSGKNNYFLNTKLIGYDLNFFEGFFNKEFKEFQKGNFFFSFFGSLFFYKIKDFFFFKTLNKFDLMFFFEDKNFDFIIFNHLHNRVFFFQILNSFFKMRKINDFFLPLINNYEFFFDSFPFKSSINFFSRQFFIPVPPLYVNLEKDLIFFFDKIWSFFFFFGKIFRMKSFSFFS